MDNRASSLGSGCEDAANRLFIMQSAFRATGGLISGDALAALLRQQSDVPLSLLARCIVNRRVVSFAAHGETWLPVFQFEPPEMGLRKGMRQVIDELRDVFNDWELTAWFASPNSWLSGIAPSVLMISHPAAVIEAAWADRLVAVG